MKEMTPKERVMAFFRHEPVDELPTDEGIFVLFNPEAYKAVSYTHLLFQSWQSL